MQVKNFLKTRYVQNEHKKNLPKDVSEGVCFGLCVLWANRKRNTPAETPENRVEQITSEDSKFAAKIQGNWNQSNTYDHEKRLWDEKGFTLGKYKSYPIDDLASSAKALTDGDAEFTAIGWRKKQGAGGHQLVSYTERNMLVLYDPNGGEFHVPKAKVAEFLTEYWVSLRNGAGLPAISSVELGRLGSY